MFDVSKIDNMTMEEVNELLNNPTKHGLTFGDVLRVADKLANVAERMNKACSPVSAEDIKEKDQEIYRLERENRALRSELDEMRNRIRQVLEMLED